MISHPRKKDSALEYSRPGRCFLYSILLHAGPGLARGGAGIIVGVGGLHDGVVGPVGLRQIHEADQLVRVAVDVALVRVAAQHVVHDDRHLSTGDGVIGTEAAVGVAADPAVGGSLSHVGVVPGAGAHIGVGTAGAGGIVGKGQCDSRKLSAGDGSIGTESTVGIAAQHTQAGQGIHGLGVPRAGGHVGEGLSDLHVLVQQQGIEHLSHLGAGHVLVGLERAVRIAAEEGVVLVGLQPAGHAGVVGAVVAATPLGVEGDGGLVHLHVAGDRLSEAQIPVPALEGVAVADGSGQILIVLGPGGALSLGGQM